MNRLTAFLTTMWVIHSASFVLEMVYQEFCYPISWSGYISSVFTHSSRLCTNIRRVSYSMDEILFKNIIH